MRLRIRESLLYGLLRLLKRLDWRNTSAAAFDPAQVRSILVISSTALGDTVLSTAAMNAVRQRYPEAHIVALIHRPYVNLFRNHPALDDVVTYRGGYRSFFGTLRILRWHKCDLALILHGNEPQATPLAYLSGARFIFKLPNTSRFHFLLANAKPIRGWRDFSHGIDQRLAVAELAGASTRGMRMSLPSLPAHERLVADWLAGNNASAGLLIGLQTGASSHGRIWPAESFAELAQRLGARFPGIRFILTGSADETGYCRHIAAAIGPAACSAAGALPIEALPALLRRMVVLVTGDTGTLHVAVAVGTPTVGLFAVSDPKASGPAHDLDRHIVIHHPCADAGMRSKSDDQRWIARIGVDEVLAAVENIMLRTEVERG